MIAILGAGGQLGTAFVRFLGHRAIPVTRRTLDLTNLEAIGPWVESVQPDLVVNCAAYTAVDAAETDEETARTVNALAVGELAAACARTGAGLVTFSTDYVFDGTKPTGYVESDTPQPLNAYGRTKLEGERLALAQHPEVLVVRTSWLLSSTHPNFASRMLDLLGRGPVPVVDDQRGSPTLVDDLALATMAAAEAGASGLLHLTNQGETTWYGLARDIAVMAGLDPALVVPCTSDEFPRAARRPPNSVLDNERLGPLGLEPLPDYATSLAAII